MTARVNTLPRPGSSLLTDSDRELIAMLADGWTLKRIASRRGVTLYVIDNQLRDLRARTGTENSTHLVATALRCGWLDGDDAFEGAA